MIAPVYIRLGRFTMSAMAYRRAVDLLGADAERLRILVRRWSWRQRGSSPHRRARPSRAPRNRYAPAEARFSWRRRRIRTVIRRLRWSVTVICRPNRIPMRMGSGVRQRIAALEGEALRGGSG